MLFVLKADVGYTCFPIGMDFNTNSKEKLSETRWKNKKISCSEYEATPVESCNWTSPSGTSQCLGECSEVSGNKLKSEMECNSSIHLFKW